MKEERLIDLEQGEERFRRGYAHILELLSQVVDGKDDMTIYERANWILYYLQGMIHTYRHAYQFAKETPACDCNPCNCDNCDCPKPKAEKDLKSELKKFFKGKNNEKKT